VTIVLRTRRVFGHLRNDVGHHAADAQAGDEARKAEREASRREAGPGGERGERDDAQQDRPASPDALGERAEQHVAEHHAEQRGTDHDAGARGIDVHLLHDRRRRNADDGEIITIEDVRALLAAYAKAVAPDDIGNLMAMTVLALGMGGRDQREMSDGTAVPMARAILQMFAGCLGFLSPGGRFVERHGGETLGAYAMRASGAEVTPAAVRALDAALIMLADHELAPATFAARVAASIDTGVCNCIAAAISAHVGYLTGAVTGRVETQLFEKCTPDALAAKFDIVREHGASLYGFNHPLYPHGDPRAAFILACAGTLGWAPAPVRNIMRFLERVKLDTGATPGIAIGLVVLTRALGMPHGSATALWIIARTAGWVAHVVEQRTQSFMLRPRAKFVAHGSKVDDGSAAE
jgi:citrate synthase